MPSLGSILRNASDTLTITEHEFFFLVFHLWTKRNTIISPFYESTNGLIRNWLLGYFAKAIPMKIFCKPWLTDPTNYIVEHLNFRKYKYKPLLWYFSYYFSPLLHPHKKKVTSFNKIFHLHHYILRILNNVSAKNYLFIWKLIKFFCESFNCRELSLSNALYCVSFQVLFFLYIEISSKTTHFYAFNQVFVTYLYIKSLNFTFMSF